VYAVQNYLLVVGASSLDSVTFNCLNQSKLVSTALCVYFVFGVRQSLTQTLALGGLLVAGAILQEGGGVASGAEKDADQTRAKVAGVAAVLAASALSGVASAATQFSLQRLRRTSTALTVEMAVAAIPCLLLAHYGASDVSDFSQREASSAGGRRSRSSRCFRRRWGGSSSGRSPSAWAAWPRGSPSWAGSC